VANFSDSPIAAVAMRARSTTRADRVRDLKFSDGELGVGRPRPPPARDQGPLGHPTRGPSPTVAGACHWACDAQARQASVAERKRPIVPSAGYSSQNRSQEQVSTTPAVGLDLAPIRRGRGWLSDGMGVVHPIVPVKRPKTTWRVYGSRDQFQRQPDAAVAMLREIQHTRGSSQRI